MNISVSKSTELVKKVYVLARPYGRRKLLLVTFLSFLQGVFQVLGVTSIFPFLALAAAPSQFRNSLLGSRILANFPELNDNQLLVTAGVFAISMLLLANAVNLCAEFVRTKYAHGFGHWLRQKLLRQIASRPYRYFLQENSSVLVKKVVADVMQYITGVLLPLLDSVARAVTILLLVGTLFFVHPQIALIAAAAFGGFYGAVFVTFGRWRAETVSGLRESQRGLFREVQQMLGGIKPIKVHCAEEPFIGRFSMHSGRQARLMAWTTIVSNGPRYLIEPLAFGGLVCVVLAYAAHEQDITTILPTLGVMALAGYRLLPAMQLLYGQLNQLGTMSHALEEVYTELKTAEEDNDIEMRTIELSAPQALEWHDAIHFEDLSFQYPGADSLVIERLNLTIPKNSSLGIVGSTGSGKSTLVDLLLGLHLPTAGRILIDDTPLGPDNRRTWRKGIGYVPQDIFLIDDTIASNIAFGIPQDEIDQAGLERAAEAAQILTFIEEETSHGWQTIVGERGVRLSGGQRQRIGLARALYHQPDLLIFDEATSALDQDTEAEVVKAIDGLSGQLTMIIIAHRLNTIRSCTMHLNLVAGTNRLPAGPNVAKTSASH